MFIDMYRSNDVVQMEREAIFIRPFVKVGEKAENVKVFQYFLEDRVPGHLVHTCVAPRAIKGNIAATPGQDRKVLAHGTLKASQA